MTNQTVVPAYVLLIEEWASARNLINGSDAKAQFFKLVSELGEWAGGVIIGDRDEVTDGIGDAFVVSTVMARQLKTNALDLLAAGKLSGFLPYSDLSILVIVGRLADALAKGQDDKTLQYLGGLLHALVKAATRHQLDINTCLSRAYNDIKDRKGVMYKGVFIKSTDERYESAVAELAAAE